MARSVQPALLRRALIVGLLARAPALAQEAPPAVDVTALPILRPHVRVTPHRLNVRRSPSTRAALKGRIDAFQPWQVLEILPEPTPGCAQGWARVDGGFACLDHSEETGATPAHLPVTLRFDPPTPAEDAEYRKTGSWPRSPDDRIELPFVYARRAGRFQGRLWASVASFEAGEPPIGRVKAGESLHFYEVVESAAGTVLVREDTTAVPLDDLYVYAVSRFTGVDLERTPAPEGAVPAWVIGSRGTPVRATPARAGEVLWTAPDRAQLWLTERRDGWLHLVDPAGAQPPGWVPDDGSARTWRPLPPPAGVEGLWIDVDLNQQIVALMDGDRAVFVTLTSTGKPGDETPEGLYRALDKVVAWDMASLPGSDEPYDVEAVPWVVHFWPRYALHGAYWHDRFGRVRSHGCVNLTVLDAHTVFDRIAPTLRPGWTEAYESPDEPGTVIRVRRDDVSVPDRRRRL